MLWSQPTATSAEERRTSAPEPSDPPLFDLPDDLEDLAFLQPPSRDVPEAWETDVALERLRGGRHQRFLVGAVTLARYSEPILVPVAAAVWLHVLALMARGL